MPYCPGQRSVRVARRYKEERDLWQSRYERLLRTGSLFSSLALGIPLNLTSCLAVCCFAAHQEVNSRAVLLDYWY